MHASSDPYKVVKMLVSKTLTVGKFKELACVKLGKSAEDVRVVDFYDNKKCRLGPASAK